MINHHLYAALAAARHNDLITEAHDARLARQARQARFARGNRRSRVRPPACASVPSARSTPLA
jgi:hypothetical protein